MELLKGTVSKVTLVLMLIGMFSVPNELPIKNTLPKPNPAITYSTSAYENVTTHEGDLIINGTQTCVIENCTYIQTGNIYVNDYAKLIVRNVVFDMIQMIHPISRCLTVDDWATLEITSSLVHNCWIGAFGYSKVSINNTSLEWLHGDGRSSISINNCGSASGLYLTGDSKTRVSNSNFQSIALCFERKQICSLDGLKPGYFGFWNLHQNQTTENVGYDLGLVNTWVYCWTLELDSDVMGVVSNSSIGEVRIRYYGTTVKVNGLRPSFYKTSSINNITLEATNVAHWTLHSHGSSIELSDVEVGICAFWNSNISILHSNVHFWTGDFSGVLYFNQSTVLLGLILRSRFYMYGNVTQIKYNGEWVQSYVTRNYNVIVRDAYGQLVSNANLTLELKDGIPVWNGSTDLQGKADFNITFNDNTYQDFWTLTATMNGINLSKPVEFLTDTPLEIMLDNMPPTAQITQLANGSVVYGTIQVKAAASDNIQLKRMTLHVDEFLLSNVSLGWVSYTHSASLNTRTLVNGTHNITATVYDASGNVDSSSILINVQNLLGDLNGDGEVDIMDISIVAKAFNSEPEHPDWDAIADVNNDEVIDILDISMVALEFGKTV
ncbi:MAG TPA: dockerin type I domain-containing protein [Candidatus Bathyarchaeia archaeon]